MARTRKKAVFIAAESTYGTDPSANGSGYTYVPALEIGELSDDLELLETNYFTNRAHGGTPPVAGRDGWSFTMTTALYGMASAAGDGTAASSVADDWLDLILDHVFAAGTSTTGQGILTVDSSTQVTTDPTPGMANQDMIMLFEAGIPTAGARMQVSRVTDVTGDVVTLSPPLTDSGSMTTAAVSYGYKGYQPSDAGGATLAFVYQQDDVVYTLLGGRCTSMTWSVDSPGQIVRCSLTFAGDTKTEDTSGKSALPTITESTQAPLKGLLSPVWHGTTQYATQSISIEWNIASAELGSTAATNGRAGYESISIAPTVTIAPLFTDAIANLKRAVTDGQLIVQLGSGVVSGGVANGMAVCAPSAVAVEANPTDENGRVRQSVQFRVTDAVNFSASVASRFIQVARY